MNIPESENFVSVSEAVQMIGCSRKKVYQYIKEGRLSSCKVGRMLVLPRDEVQQLQLDRQVKAPPWLPPPHPGELPATTIHVRIRPGKQAELEKRLAAVEEKQKYTFTGSVARYIMGDNESIEIVLIWNKAEMPDEATWQHDLQLFQQAFEDVLDWDTATTSWGNVLRHT